jgi:hypothetical protein
MCIYDKPLEQCAFLHLYLIIDTTVSLHLYLSLTQPCTCRWNNVPPYICTSSLTRPHLHVIILHWHFLHHYSLTHPHQHFIILLSSVLKIIYTTAELRQPRENAAHTTSSGSCTPHPCVRGEVRRSDAGRCCLSTYGGCYFPAHSELGKVQYAFLPQS